jgi:ADP-heptose:LPS heptosyltransferase
VSGVAVRQRLRLAALQVVGAAARRGARPPEVVAGRTVIVRPDHLGDVLMATAAVRALRARRPEAELVALVGPWSAPVLATNPDLDAVFAYRFPWFDRVGSPLAERYAAAAALATRLRALGFAEALILRPDHWWGALAAALAGIPRRIGYAVPECAPFLTGAHPVVHGEHVVRGALRLVGGEGLAAAARPGRPAMRFELPPVARQGVRQRLRALGLSRRGGFAVLHPGASSPAKSWPADRWRAVVEHLAGRGVPTVLVSAPGGEGELSAIGRGEAYGATRDLHELGALLAEARLALGLDSAAMHVATAVGTPTVRLYGPGDERQFGPWGDPRRHRALRAAGSAPDHGWFDAPAAGPHPSMLALDVATVTAELDGLLR